MRSDHRVSDSVGALAFDAPLRRVKSMAPSRASLLAAVEDALAQFAEAAERGYHVFMTAAEHAFTQALGAAQVSIVVHSAGGWRRWDHVDEPRNSRNVIDLPPDVMSRHTPTPLADGLFVPIRAGMLAALVTAPRDGKDGESIAASLAIAADLALTSLERKRVAAEEGEELDVMQRVALRILKSHDLQEIFLLITHETRRLLGADICGIMLREGNSVVMQRCVGNFSPATASLRMSVDRHDDHARRRLVEHRLVHVRDQDHLVTALGEVFAQGEGHRARRLRSPDPRPPPPG